MKNSLDVFDSGLLPPCKIMLKDANLLANLKSYQNPILHFYQWQGNCLTYGHFISPERHLHLNQLKTYQLQIAKRPTGGGIIFHLTDFAFSLLIPATHPFFSLNTLDNYALINCCLADLVREWIDDCKSEWRPPFLLMEQDIKSSYPLFFCMAQPTVYDVMIKGKKVAGAAQRKTSSGFLHQGSLSLAPLPEKMLIDVLKEPSVIIEAMQRESFYLVDTKECSKKKLQKAREKLKQQLIIHLTKKFESC